MDVATSCTSNGLRPPICFATPEILPFYKIDVIPYVSKLDKIPCHSLSYCCSFHEL